jgi:hypothetical protein
LGDIILQKKDGKFAPREIDKLNELKKDLRELEKDPTANRKRISDIKKEIKPYEKLDMLAFRLNNYATKYLLDPSKYKDDRSEFFNELKEKVKDYYAPVNVMYRNRELGNLLGLPFPGKGGPLRRELIDLERQHREMQKEVEFCEHEKLILENRRKEEGQLSQEDATRLEHADKRINDFQHLSNRISVINAQIYLYSLELFGIIKPSEGILFDRLRKDIDKIDEEITKGVGNKALLDKKWKEYTEKAIKYQFAYLLKRGELDVLKDPESDLLKPSYGRLTSKESIRDLERLRQLYPHLEMEARKIALDMEEIDQKLRVQELKNKRDEVRIRNDTTDVLINSIFATLPQYEQYKDKTLETKRRELELTKRKDLEPQLTELQKMRVDKLFGEKEQVQRRLNLIDDEIRTIETSNNYLKEITKAWPYDPAVQTFGENLKRWWGPSWYGSRLERFSRWVKGEGAYDAWVPDQRRKVEIQRQIHLVEKVANEIRSGVARNDEYKLEENKQLGTLLKKYKLIGEDGEFYLLREKEKLRRLDKLKGELEENEAIAGRWIVKKHQGLEYVIESPEYRWVKPLYKASRLMLIGGAIAGGVVAPGLGLVLVSPLIAKKGVEKVADWSRFGGAVAPGSSERSLRDIQIVEYWTTRGRGAYPLGAVEAWNDYVYYGEFWKRGTRITSDGHLYFHKDSIKLKPVGMEGIFYPLRFLKGIVEPPVLDKAAQMRLEFVADTQPGGKAALAQILVENPMVKIEIGGQTPHQQYNVLGVTGTRPYPELVQSFMGHPEQRLGMPFEEAALYVHVMRNESLDIADRAEKMMFKEKMELSRAYEKRDELESYENLIDRAIGDPTREERMKSIYANKMRDTIAHLTRAIDALEAPRLPNPDDHLIKAELKAEKDILEYKLSFLLTTTIDEEKRNLAIASFQDWKGDLSSRITTEENKPKVVKNNNQIIEYKGRLEYINAMLQQLATTSTS